MLILYYDLYIGTANGDIDFGSRSSGIRPFSNFHAINIDNQPTFQFIGSGTGSQFHFITFDVNADNILEGQEIGLLTIERSTYFDGFLPRFQSVRIVINDTNSEWIELSFV